MSVVNITMLVHDRAALTKQALGTLDMYTQYYTLDVLDDASDPSAILVGGFVRASSVWRNEESRGTGLARNQVAAYAARRRGKYLYFSDNDVCFTPNWLEALVESFEFASTLGFVALGAVSHPYLHPNRRWPFYSAVLNRTLEVADLDALPLQSWLMRWEDWDRYGEFCQTPVGMVRQSEDHEYSQRIRRDGKRVGVVLPHLIYNCGVTDSFGKPIPGAELIPRPEGVLVE